VQYSESKDNSSSNRGGEVGECNKEARETRIGKRQGSGRANTRERNLLEGALWANPGRVGAESRVLKDIKVNRTALGQRRKARPGARLYICLEQLRLVGPKKRNQRDGERDMALEKRKIFNDRRMEAISR